MYQALYRKYRPQVFPDVVGQEHITETLQNQIKSGKTAHAYLFTGSRGTGKTTCARIFAKAVNCQNPKDGNPCLECEICKEADSGSLPDIIEIDAASNNGIADVRDLREGAAYTPERCKLKIYIIDEVHMLSKDAFNALLKIMEEPPPHVKFILATTELHKVLPTVISRCQRFDFRRVSVPDITDRLQFVAEAEHIALDPDAAVLISKTADGGMRDALSLLDTCMAYGEHITLETVSSAAGIAGRDKLFELVTALAEKNAPGAVSITDSLYAESKDLVRLSSELVTEYRNIMMIKALPELKDGILALPEEIEILSKIADTLPLETIFKYLAELGNLTDSLSRAIDKRSSFELCMIKLCTDLPQTPASVQLPMGQTVPPTAQAVPSNVQAQPTPAQAQPTPAQAVLTTPRTDPSQISINDFKPLPEWDEIVNRFAETAPHIAATLKVSNALCYENMLLIYTENKFFLELIKRKENAEALRTAAREITGRQFFIRAKCVTPAETPGSTQNAEAVINAAVKNNIPTEIL
jgi:DNA polymerase-3 subunit gamma/tau